MEGKYDKGNLFVSGRSTGACHKTIRLQRVRAIVNNYLLSTGAGGAATVDTNANADHTPGSHDSVTDRSNRRYDFCVKTLNDLANVLRNSEIRVDDVISMKPTAVGAAQAAVDTAYSVSLRPVVNSLYKLGSDLGWMLGRLGKLFGRLVQPRVGLADMFLMSLVVVGLYCYVDTLMRSLNLIGVDDHGGGFGNETCLGMGGAGLTGPGMEPEPEPYRVEVPDRFGFRYVGASGNASCSCVYDLGNGTAVYESVSGLDSELNSSDIGVDRATTGAGVGLAVSAGVYWGLERTFRFCNNVVQVLVYLVMCVTWLVYRVFCLFMLLLLVNKSPAIYKWVANKMQEAEQRGRQRGR